MADYTLSAKITGDSGGFDKAVQNAEKAASSFEKKMEGISNKAKSIGDKISGIGTKLTAGITMPLALAGKGMVDAASDFAENLNKISVAFGDNAAEVKAWADAATQSFGLSMNQALEATALFGDMATSMGLSQAEAANMATSLSGLAGDLASFKNIGIDQAMTALNGVFTGETESLKQLGIVMTEVNLQEFADGLGLIYDDMTQAEKVQLRYNYVMAMSKNAIGDYARTSDGTANSMRTFQASVENLAITLGQNLLPIITPIIQKATEMVNVFAEADPKIQQLVLKMAGISAVAGPALIVFGKIVSSLGAVTGAFGKVSAAITKLGGMKAAVGKVFSAITSPVGLATAGITALVAAFAYLMATNEDFRESVMGTVGIIVSSLQPVLTTLGELVASVGSTIMNLVANVLQQLAPILAQMISYIGQIVSGIAPLLEQLINSLAPVITQLMSFLSELVQALIPPVIDILNAVMAVIGALIPPIQRVVAVVVDVVSSVISAISPIIDVITHIITRIVEVISPIVSFIANVISQTVEIVAPLLDFFAGLFQGIWEVTSAIFSKIGGFISTIFTGVKNAWDGLKDFVGGVVNGIANAFNEVANVVKSVINVVIGAINGAIWAINLIPGVNIQPIAYLQHGTDDWQGGFAYMNEGGRGELTYLPNGAQVIPHDISVKYAKEAARANNGAESLDISGILEGVVISIDNSVNVGNHMLRDDIANYTLKKMGTKYKAVLAAKGAW